MMLLLPSHSSCSMPSRVSGRTGFRSSRALHGTPLAAHRAGKPGRDLLRSRVYATVVDSSDAEQEGQSSSPPGDAEARAKAQLRQTMAGLDALLGIEEEVEPEAEEAANKVGGVDISFSKDVLKAIADAEAARNANARGAAAAAADGADGTTADSAQRMKDSLERIAEQARKLSKDDAASSTLGEQAIRSEFENLLSVLAGERGVDPADLKVIKEKAFGQSSFWITETRPVADVEGGVLVRGNLRGPREAVFKETCDKLKELFGDKYTLRLVVDVESETNGESSMKGEPRVAFEVLPTSMAVPEPAQGWQRGAAGLLLLLTFASTLQFALTCNIGLLPKETLAWLANPANLNSEVLPPGLESYDPTPFLTSAVNVFLVTLLPQLAHETAHGVSAQLKGIKIGPSFLVPNSQLGTFGSVTQFKSLVRSRTDLFDFAASGLAAGGAVSLALFLAGLALSHGGGAAEAGMVPVPAALFQGSFLLGTLSKLALDAEALTHANVYVSPLLVGGWCGLVTTALNCLPVGNLDGGRTMLAAYGKNALAVSSLLCYIGLGLGLLGSALALPFGLYVLICQRTSERYIQDEVSGVDDARRRGAAVIVALAVAVLLPAGVDVNPDLLNADPANFL